MLRVRLLQLLVSTLAAIFCTLLTYCRGRRTLLISRKFALACYALAEDDDGLLILTIGLTAFRRLRALGWNLVILHQAIAFSLLLLRYLVLTCMLRHFGRWLARGFHILEDHVLERLLAML